MSLRKTIEVITKLVEQHTIDRYAIAGAVAALNYIQPTLTEDLDVLVSVEHFDRRASGLILLAPIEKALAEMGYPERRDVGIMVEGWPVQFLPTASKLDEEALGNAVDADFDRTGGSPLTVRCLGPEYLVAIALKVGRLKDLARVQSFIEQKAVNLAILKDILVRHGLLPAWQAFCARAGIDDSIGKA